jgi:ubiquinone/menaquinone biosynthesis C-methylase UbiE
MQIAKEQVQRTCPEMDIIDECLALDGRRILELGCGRAELTRAIATAGHDRQVLALEVDEVQHALHQQITDLDNVEFRLAGAEDIPADDNSVDVVFMFKSLHHVPEELMAKSFDEISRVLSPGGYAYISEPVFAGDFNEILRLFHDEQYVRNAAFNAIRAAVDSGRFELADELFFNTPMHFENFSDFEEKVIGATHTDHQLSAELQEQVSSSFEKHMADDGANFVMPLRVDLLRKPFP